MPVTDAQRMQLESLQGRIISHIKIKALNMAQLQLQTDLTKAVGSYKGAYVSPRPNRPQVTIQRPYFDVTTSKVVDRTMILMSR